MLYSVFILHFPVIASYDPSFYFNIPFQLYIFDKNSEIGRFHYFI